MKLHIIKISFLALFLGFIAGCSDDTTSPDNGNGTLAMSTELASSGKVTSSTFAKKFSPMASFADSLQVTSTAIVISNLKLHHDDDSTSDSTHDGTIKTGPFLLVFDSTGSHVVLQSPIPAGTYDRIKFEIHKLRNIDQGLRDSLPDFVAQDATIRIMGYVWIAGVKMPFTYYANNTENIVVQFSPPITIQENSTTNVTLQFDPVMAFSDGGVLNPLDPSNHNDIKGAIDVAFKAMKK